MRSTLFFILFTGLGVGLLACVSITSDEHSQIEIVESSPQQVPIEDMEKGPIALFEDACARCHGPFGTFYGDEFANLDDKHLEYVVFDMMVGPSQLEVNETEIEAMIDYHRALNAERLFVSVNNGKSLRQGRANLIQGDKSPSSTVHLHKGGEIYKPRQDKYTWVLKESLLPPFDVVVEKGKEQESFQFPHRQWNDVKE